MTTVKKIILFLFGIVLIVFGNKAAINTIFKDSDDSKKIEPEEKQPEVISPVIIEEVEVVEPEEKVVATETKPEPKKETTKVPAVKQVEKAEATPEKVEKTEDVKVTEVPETKIEPVQEESAAASE